jgi:hypothetical protein
MKKAEYDRVQYDDTGEFISGLRKSKTLLARLYWLLLPAKRVTNYADRAARLRPRRFLWWMVGGKV